MYTRSNHRVFKNQYGSVIEQYDLYDAKGDWWGIEETAQMTTEEVERIWGCKVFLK